MGRTESFFATCFSVQKKVTVWESLDLDFMLNESCILVQNLAGSDKYNLDKLPLLVKTDDDNFEAHRTLHHTKIFHGKVHFINYYNSFTTFEIDDGQF